MNYFLEAHENLSIDELISSLKNSLDNHNRAAILALCFIIPDLLSKNMGNNKKENYIKWFELRKIKYDGKTIKKVRLNIEKWQVYL